MAKIYHTLKKSKELHKIHSKRGRHGQRNTMLKTDENKLKEIRSTDTVLKQERHETSLKETQPKDTVLKNRDHSHTLDENQAKKEELNEKKNETPTTPYKSNDARNKAMLNRATKFNKPKKPHYQRRISTHHV